MSNILNALVISSSHYKQLCVILIASDLLITSYEGGSIKNQTVTDYLAGTWRLNNDALTSMQSHPTTSLRHYVKDTESGWEVCVGRMGGGGGGRGERGGGTSY